MKTRVRKKHTKKNKEPDKRQISLQKSIEINGNFITVPLLNEMNIHHKNIKVGTNVKNKFWICGNIMHDPRQENSQITFEKAPDPKYAFYRTRRHKLNPTDEQRIKLHNYADAYIDMYNLCVEHLAEIRRNHIEKHQLNDEAVSKLRYCDLNLTFDVTELQQHFNAQRREIQKERNGVNLRVLKYAIHDFIAMFDSIVTNQQRGHVKNSKMRVIKHTKKTKIFKVEKDMCSENGFFYIKGTYKGDPLKITPKMNYLKDYETAYTIQYVEKDDSFYLLRRSKVKQTAYQKPYGTIAIDLGVRTLGTGIADNHILEMGIGFGKYVENSLRRIDEVKKFSTKERKNYPMLKQHKVDKIVSRLEDKLTNKITDVQWKYANYLTTHYKTILVGNMSSAGMNKQKQGKPYLLATVKKLNMYKFREKIKYKSLMRSCKYKTVNEAFTTQCCVNCGKVNHIGSSKIYECSGCCYTYDRDVKSAGCIYLKALTLPKEIEDELQQKV